VPGVVVAALDVRHGKDEAREAAVAILLEAAQAIGAKREIAVSHEVRLEQGAVGMDERMTWLLGQSALECGQVAVPVVSGAGHDAMIVAERVPAAMLFVRTPGGVSHHPEEDVRVEDVEAALRVTLDFLSKLEPGVQHG
jgi:allantoate deiminase